MNVCIVTELDVDHIKHASEYVLNNFCEASWTGSIVNIDDQRS